MEEVLKYCKDALSEPALTKANWMVHKPKTTGNGAAEALNASISFILEERDVMNEQIKETRDFLRKAIESRGCIGSLYLCGRPGTGKVRILESIVWLPVLIMIFELVLTKWDLVVFHPIRLLQYKCASQKLGNGPYLTRRTFPLELRSTQRTTTGMNLLTSI